jgi:serine/threonine protein kinase/Tfp pilus assembly protein PilF
MTPELWQRLKPLFHNALEEATQDRAAYVAAACGNDPELKKHLEQLLQAEQQNTGTHDAPLANLNGFFEDRSARFQPGELVLGRFRIIRPVGKGGMGEVYEAEDLQLGIIALKTIRYGVASSSDAFERFRQEVQLARRVTGAQVCRIHELYLLPASGKFEATAFLTMEYLEGITLYEKIQRNGPVPWKQALNIALQICEGLQLIHEQGVIHRDLKTGNIMLCKQADATRVVVMDFGLARDFRPDTQQNGRSSATEKAGRNLPPMIMGTPEYMAPEQFEGKPVSPATDIYALGIILYELVTGLRPYAADTPVAAAIRRAKQPLPPSSLRSRVPGQCDRIIERCLEYEPEKRFQSAKEVAKALRAGPANLENLKRDRPWILWFASATLLGLIAGTVVYFWQARQYYHPSPEALRWYDTGLAALREGNNVKATRSLQQAIAQDNHFVMAHARLAEAWANLDFDGNAQREFLLATPGGRYLEPIDRMYLDAIHATVTKDSPAEIATYRQILNRLPPDQKASGYLDLGIAYERAGDPTKALEDYKQAASIDKDSPAPFMRTAVLQTRLHHVPEAEQAFQRAQTLLSTEMNQEGLAELDYARGYAANDAGKSAEAKQYLQRSLDEATKIPSVQLQIRALTQLSGATYRSDASQSAKYAEEAIRLARENQLDVWAADGLVRLASADLHQGKLKDAEEPLREALQIARQTQQPRVEALANLTLASLMNQEGFPDKVTGPAQSALDYYRKNGYFAPAAGASILLIRAKRDQGQYQQALESGTAFLESATKSGIRLQMMRAEENIGSVYSDMEQYPEALTHFEKAGAFADTASDRAYQALHSAETLWKLGRYSESDAKFQFEPVGDLFLIMAAEIRADSLLSKRQYKEAINLSREMLSKYPSMESGDQQQFVLDRTIAEAHLGLKREALSDLDGLEKRPKPDGPTKEMAWELTLAEIEFNADLSQQAHDKAGRVAKLYSSSGQLDSALRSSCLAASASKRLNNGPEFNTYSAIVVDIVSRIKQTWSPQVSKTYFSRPDIQMLLRDIPVATP